MTAVITRTSRKAKGSSGSTSSQCFWASGNITAVGSNPSITIAGTTYTVAAAARTRALWPDLE